MRRASRQETIILPWEVLLAIVVSLVPGLGSSFSRSRYWTSNIRVPASLLPLSFSDFGTERWSAEQLFIQAALLNALRSARRDATMWRSLMRVMGRRFLRIRY